MNEEYVEIGYTQKPHGLKGELKVFIEDDFLDELPHLDVFFLKIRGKLLPYFVEKKRGAADQIMKFEEVDTKEAATFLKTAAIFVRRNDLKYWEEPEEEEETLIYGHCMGFEVIDAYDGNLGTIENILAYPQQEFAVILVKKKEVLLPLNDFTVKSIDEDKKQVFVEMPEGILELE